jgi:hypothetical protein
MGEDAYLGGLAIAGSRVVSYWKASGNLESDDYLLVSSPASSKGRLVATAARTGQAQCGAAGGGPTPACAGPWLGGLVGSGNRILVNRWTTDTSGAVSNAGLYAVVGSRFKRVVAGPDTVEAVAADSQRVAVLQWRWYVPGRTIHVFSSTGRRLSSVTPKGSPLEVAVSGSNLVVLERSGVLALYNANTGSLRRTFNLHATQALAVHGNIAVYSRPTRIVQRIVRASAIHALNLSTGKNRVVGRSPGQIAFAGIDSVGLVYAAGRWPRNSIVFVPFARVSAAVS